MNTVYGRTAIAAAKEFQKNKNADPRIVWQERVRLETDKKSSQIKGCPKTTFLTLCLDGYILGVPAKPNLGLTSKNADYTRQMMQEIKSKKGKINSKKELWEIVTDLKKPKNENGQTSVVFALLKNDLLDY